MKIKSPLRTLAAATLLTAAVGAQAGTVTFSGWAYNNTGNSVSLVTPNPSYSGGLAGGFTVNLSGFSEFGGALSGAFEAYCVDIYEHIGFNQPYSSYSIVSAASHFSAAQATALGRLISYVNDNNVFGAAGDKDQQSTALQLAVWNIVYDSDNTVSTGSFLETASTYKTTSVNMYMGANDLLSNSQAARSSAGYDLFVLRSVGNPGQQDQLIWRRSAVPEPASLALVALALAGAGVATRRRRA